MKIVAISDQHGHLPEIPECDLLIVAGDIAPDYPKGFARADGELGSREQNAQQQRWFEQVWVPWRHRQPADRCYLTWGNHDFFAEKFHQRVGADEWWDDKTGALVDDDVVDDESGLHIWFTPWSRTFMRWAFMLPEDRLAERYAMIPTGIDILVTHQPPYGVCDTIPGVHADDCPLRYHLSRGPEGCTCGNEAHLGSTALAEAIQRVRPRVVVCGHIHNGYGTGELDWLDATTGCTCFESVGISKVYNVSVVNEAYDLVHPPTVIELGE